MSMAEDYLDAYDIEEEYERVYKDAGRGIWTTKDGRHIAVSDMTDEHIVNTLNMLKRNDSCDMYLPWIERFEAELQKRRGEKQRMTRAEARQFIIDHCCPNYEHPDNTQWDTAMAMAIEALTDEPDCCLKAYGECSYSETGCSDCRVKEKIREALRVYEHELG